MKRFLKLCSLTAIVAAFTVSVLGGQASAVVNGKPATLQYGAASIWYPDSSGVNRNRCAASIISKYWAVTSAHCQASLVPGQTQVRTSSVNNAVGGPNGYEDVGLAQVYVNPGYVVPPGDNPDKNDIALIRFQRPVTRTQPLPMSTSPPMVNTSARLAGWGWICDTIMNPPNCGLPYSNILQELNVQIAPDSRCEWMGDPSTESCILGANGEHAMACRGDSGAPVVKSVLQRWILTAIVDGDGDFELGHPHECTENINGGQGAGQVTDIAPYIPWINSTISAASNSNPAHMPQVVKN